MGTVWVLPTVSKTIVEKQKTDIERQAIRTLKKQPSVKNKDVGNYLGKFKGEWIAEEFGGHGIIVAYKLYGEKLGAVPIWLVKDGKVYVFNDRARKITPDMKDTEELSTYLVYQHLKKHFM